MIDPPPTYLLDGAGIQLAVHIAGGVAALLTPAMLSVLEVPDRAGRFITSSTMDRIWNFRRRLAAKTANPAWPRRCVNLPIAMTFPVRHTILILLLLLPIQGVVAATRWSCFAPAEQGAAVVTSAHHAHPSTGHSHHRDAAHDVGTNLDASHDSGAPISHDAGGTCHLCAACCLTGAAPPPPLVLSTMPPAHAGFPPVFVPVPHNVADGPERPPRTV